MALRDSKKLLEVEFPPLPANVLDLDDVSAYDVSQANLKLAVDFAKGLLLLLLNSNSNSNSGNNNGGGDLNKIAILLPDESEAKISIETLTGGGGGRGNDDDDTLPATLEVAPGVTVSSLRRSEDGDDRFIKVRANVRSALPLLLPLLLPLDFVFW